jgi:hypothetical protein
MFVPPTALAVMVKTTPAVAVSVVGDTVTLVTALHAGFTVTVETSEFGSVFGFSQSDLAATR